MIDGHVVGQARPGQPLAEGSSGVAESRDQERPRLGQVLERPEAVHDADLEALLQERSTAVAPRAVLGSVAAQRRDVVATVVMDTPFAALVWGRVLPLQTLDTEAILQFDQVFGERTNPESFCSPAPSANPSDGASAAPSAS